MAGLHALSTTMADAHHGSLERPTTNCPLALSEASYLLPVVRFWSTLLCHCRCVTTAGVSLPSAACAGYERAADDLYISGALRGRARRKHHSHDRGQVRGARRSFCRPPTGENAVLHCNFSAGIQGEPSVDTILNPSASTVYPARSGPTTMSAMQKANPHYQLLYSNAAAEKRCPTPQGMGLPHENIGGSRSLRQNRRAEAMDCLAVYKTNEKRAAAGPLYCCYERRFSVLSESHYVLWRVPKAFLEGFSCGISCEDFREVCII